MTLQLIMQKNKGTSLGTKDPATQIAPTIVQRHVHVPRKALLHLRNSPPPKPYGTKQGKKSNKVLHEHCHMMFHGLLYHPMVWAPPSHTNLW